MTLTYDLVHSLATAFVGFPVVPLIILSGLLRDALRVWQKAATSFINEFIAQRSVRAFAVTVHFLYCILMLLTVGLASLEMPRSSSPTSSDPAPNPEVDFTSQILTSIAGAIISYIFSAPLQRRSGVRTVLGTQTMIIVQPYSQLYVINTSKYYPLFVQLIVFSVRPARVISALILLITSSAITLMIGILCTYFPSVVLGPNGSTQTRDVKLLLLTLVSTVAVAATAYLTSLEFYRDKPKYDVRNVLETELTTLDTVQHIRRFTSRLDTMLIVPPLLSRYITMYALRIAPTQENNVYLIELRLRAGSRIIKRLHVALSKTAHLDRPALVL